MVRKWVVYVLTLVTYACTHGARTCWSLLHHSLSEEPYDLSTGFIASIDMVLLFSLAISMNLLSSFCERYGPKRCLIITSTVFIIYRYIYHHTPIGLLTVCMTMGISLMIMTGSTNHFGYVLMVGLLLGIASSLCWPSCLIVENYSRLSPNMQYSQILSRYFSSENAMSLSLWNSTSQLGDLIAMGIYQVLVNWCAFNVGAVFVGIALCIAAMTAANQIKLGEGNQNKVKEIDKDKDRNKERNIDKQKESNKQRNTAENRQTNTEDPNVDKQQENQQEFNPKELVEEKQSDNGSDAQISNQVKQNKDELRVSIEESPIKLQILQVETQNKQAQSPISFLRVWTLPGVALHVLSYSLIKSVNSILVSWLPFYLIDLGLSNEAIAFTVLWTISVVLGGVVTSITTSYNKGAFTCVLLCASALFIGLQEMQFQTQNAAIAISVFICGLLYGGPYNLMSTAIPLHLSSRVKIANVPGAKSRIISVMEGCGQLVCGISLLLVPHIGILNIHFMGSFYCGMAGVLLLAEIIRQSLQDNQQPVKNKKDKQQEKNEVRQV